MSGRIFQGVVLQMKENTDRTIGVMDGEGVVVACSELTLIGQRWAEYVNPIRHVLQRGVMRDHDHQLGSPVRLRGLHPGGQ